MKNQLTYMLILVALSGMITTSFSLNLPGEPNKALTIIESNLEMSENISNPPVNNSVEVVQLTFSEALDKATVQGSVKLFRIDAKGIASELPCYLRIDYYNPAILAINSKPVQKFADGVEYKIEVSGNLKSKSGATMGGGSSLYFATNVSPGLSSTGNTEVKRNKIVVISDIHLGMDSKFAEINKNFNNLVDLLTKVRTAPDVKELVIGGDLMDQWFVPMNYKTPVDEAAFVDAIAANNKPFVVAIVAIIKDGKIKVTYAPGNHDITVTEADIARVFPGINQARGSVQGLGEYVTGDKKSIVIEHGHKYNFSVHLILYR